MKYLSIWAIVGLVLYLVGSFVAWDFDPSMWNPLGRFSLATVWLFISMAACSIAADQ